MINIKMFMISTSKQYKFRCSIFHVNPNATHNTVYIMLDSSRSRWSLN